MDIVKGLRAIIEATSKGQARRIAIQILAHYKDAEQNPVDIICNDLVMRQLAYWKSRCHALEALQNCQSNNCELRAALYSDYLYIKKQGEPMLIDRTLFIERARKKPVKPKTGGGDG